MRDRVWRLLDALGYSRTNQPKEHGVDGVGFADAAGNRTKWNEWAFCCTFAAAVAIAQRVRPRLRKASVDDGSELTCLLRVVPMSVASYPTQRKELTRQANQRQSNASTTHKMCSGFGVAYRPLRAQAHASAVFVWMPSMSPRRVHAPRRW